MKYHLTIWTDDGIKREFDASASHELTLTENLQGFLECSARNEVFHIMDADGKEWFFNWSHVLGGTIRKVEEK